MNMFSKKRSTVSNFQRLSIKENQQDSSCAFVKGRTSRIQDKNSEAVCSAPEMLLRPPSHYTAPEEFEVTTVTGHFGFVFRENSFREITLLPWRMHNYRKTPFSKRFLRHENVVSEFSSFFGL